MWKWTDNENIKAVLLDVNSMPDEHVYYSFEEVIPGIKVFEVSKYPNTPLDGHIGIEYYDILELLYKIMREYSLNSSEIVAISGDTTFLKEMMQNHIGTVYVGEIDKEQLKHTADYSNKNLDNFFTDRNGGYSAEITATGIQTTHKVLLQFNQSIRLSDGNMKIIYNFFGGRYYPNHRGYILDDPLTTILLSFKYRYNNAVDQYFDDAVSYLNQIKPIDILTYVPMKPEDIKINRFNRFQSLKLPKTNQKGIYLRNILRCEKDFSQKYNDAAHRFENVKGAYTLLEDVHEKNVLIIDDLYSTGATIGEIAKLLYEKGAKSVVAVFLAVNQITDSSSQNYKHICCPKCGSEMKLMLSRDNQLFFGCSNYPECRFNFNKDVGLKILKEINQITIDNVYDLEDIY